MTLQPLLDASPAIQIHVAAAVAAFVLGAVILFRRKGDRPHRLGGRLWVGLMLVVTLSSVFIHTIRVWGIWSPIHLLSIATTMSLVGGVAAVRARNVQLHRRTMRSTYVGALLVAGFFTFMPGRTMHEVVFGTAPAAAARRGPSLLDIVAGTPVWVWPLLLYVLYVGWSASRDRVVPLWRLLVMPVVFAVLAVSNLLSAGPSGFGLLAFAAGAVGGAGVGWAVAARRPARRLPDGRLALRGDWLPLLLVVAIFSVRYATGVVTALDPSLANDVAFRTTGLFLSGLFSAMMIAGTVGVLWPSGRVDAGAGRFASR